MMEQNPFPEKRKKREERETSTGTRAGTKRNQHIMMEQNPFPGKERREKKGDKHRNPSRNQEEQQIMMEQRPFLARIENPIQLKSCLEKKRQEGRQEGRQAPEPEPEPARSRNS